MDEEEDTDNFMLPIQTMEQEQSRNWSGEKQLLFAALAGAVENYQKCSARRTRREQRLFEEEARYISSDRTDHIFTFVNLCGAIGIDPDYIRRGLQRWETRFCPHSYLRAAGAGRTRLLQPSRAA